MVNTGFRLVIGSWKIIEMRLPRIACKRLADTRKRSSPSKTIEPLGISAGGFGKSPSTAIAVTDFPQPDSPTTASVSPRRTS
jgi:hypothetical protein